MKKWMTGFVDLFGKRRRSYGSTLSESLEARDSQDEFEEETPELLRVKRESIGKCLNDSCPVCKVLYGAENHDSYWAYRRGKPRSHSAGMARYTPVKDSRYTVMNQDTFTKK